MTANKRIFLNIVATYGRSLYALIIGLFCGRWTLMALGQVDYGLMGVVGGLIGFVMFFNNLMASAVGRFYAFAVGEEQKLGEEEGIENCQRWFNLALLIHTALPTILVAIGYPVGCWAIENYLVIPPDKITACIWVWRFSCIACFVSMLNVPFQAMYTAKQEIAELTIYSFATTTLNAIFLYYMITHPGFWLVKFMAWTCFLGVVPQLLIGVFAFVHFRECRIRLTYMWDAQRMKELFIYAGGRFMCVLAQMFSSQGTIVAVNKILGPIRNAAMSVGNTVVGHTSTLTSSFTGAMYPAITNAAGSGDMDKMRTLSYRMCKLATVATMVFAVPLILESEEVLILWLKNPPEGTAYLCALILIANIINHMTDGHWMAIFACGKVTAFNICESIGFFLSFGIAIVMMKGGFDIASAGYGIIFGYVYAMIIKLGFSRKLCGFSVRYWARKILFPIVITCGISVVVGSLPRMIMNASFVRVCVTTAISEMVMLALTWVFIFEHAEKEFVLNQLRAKFGRFLCHNSR